MSYGIPLSAKQPQWRWAIAIVFCLMISGCDKLPKMSELGGKKTSEKTGSASETAPDADPAEIPSTDPVADAAADPADPASMIPMNPYAGISVADFLKLKTYDNDALAAVATPSNDLSAVTVLNLSGSNVTSDGLKHLPRFVNLVELDLGHITSLLDADLQYLAGLKQLEKLNLESTEVPSSGLKHLVALDKLKELNLSSTSMSEKDFIYLKQLPALEALHVSNTEIDGSGFSVFKPRGLRIIDANNTHFGLFGFYHIANSKTLEVLNVSESDVNDNCLLALKGCTNLRILDLSKNSVSSFGFRTLGGLRNLERLDLFGNSSIDDMAFNAIKNYKKLKILGVDKTGVSRQALLHLKKEYIPDLQLPGIQ